QHDQLDGQFLVAAHQRVCCTGEVRDDRDAEECQAALINSRQPHSADGFGLVRAQRYGRSNFEMSACPLTPDADAYTQPLPNAPVLTMERMANDEANSDCGTFTVRVTVVPALLGDGAAV